MGTRRAHGSAEPLCSAVKLHHVVKQEMMSSAYSPLGLPAMGELAKCSLLLGEKTEKTGVMCQCGF